MSSDASTSSRLSPSFSHIALGRQQGNSTPESTALAAPRLSQTGEIRPAIQQDFGHASIFQRGAERQLLLRTPQTPADTVLNHFRVVRQQDQALQTQRHDALQRLSDHHASAAVRQHIASGRAGTNMALLMQRNGRKLPPNLMKDAILLMDRAHSSRLSLPAGPDRHRGSDLSRPATSTASGHTGRVESQQWAPEPCSLACTSFRQSLPPHTSEHAVAVTRKLYTPTSPQGASQSSLSRRTAYGEVLRRVKSAHRPSQQPTADRRGADGLGPWGQ